MAAGVDGYCVLECSVGGHVGIGQSAHVIEAGVGTEGRAVKEHNGGSDIPCHEQGVECGAGGFGRGQGFGRSGAGGWGNGDQT